jgi:hypothetical protein
MLLGLMLLLVAPAAALSRTASVYREKVNGYASGYAGDCPDVAPALPGVCTEWFISPFRAGVAQDGGGVAPPKSSWDLFLLHHTLTFPGGGGDPEESDVALAFVPVSAVTYDRQHLRYASVRATDIPLSDGTTADVDARWEATSDRFVFGNNGPALADFGLVRHVNDECLTANYQGHQKFRIARMDATVNGLHYSYEGGFISLNHFVFVEVHKHGCT